MFQPKHEMVDNSYSSKSTAEYQYELTPLLFTELYLCENLCIIDIVNYYQRQTYPGNPTKLLLCSGNLFVSQFLKNFLKSLDL